MTVSQLIEKLKELDQNRDIFVWDDCMEFSISQIIPITTDDEESAYCIVSECTYSYSKDTGDAI